MKPELSHKIKKNTQISIFIKICPLRVKLLHVEIQMDMIKLIVSFHNFANVFKF